MQNTEIKNIILNASAQRVFGEFLYDQDITEITINKPGEIWTAKHGVWTQHINEALTLEVLQNFSPAFAGFNNTGIDEFNPSVSGTLETGERVHVVYPPAGTKGTISVTLRKPSQHIFSHASYIDGGYYDSVNVDPFSKQSTGTIHLNDELKELYAQKSYPRFFELAVETGRTIVFAGATGSGKTSFMNTLIEYIPLESRIITIEDTPEIKFYKHKNYVHLYYGASTNQDAILTPSGLLKACLRMKPDRIILSEIGGSESWDFLKALESGYRGSMTSIRASNMKEAISGIIIGCLQHSECRNFTYEIMERKVLSSIDIICHIECKNGQRYISDIYFKDLHQSQ